MGLRVSNNLELRIGRENGLSDLVFDAALSQLFDTLDHASVGTVTLAAGETNYVLPFGDVAQGRLLYLEATGPVRLTPGGALSTAAIVTGVAGSYPTGFLGTEGTLDIEVDGTAIAVQFDVSDQSLTQVVRRINSEAALLGLAPVASEAGSELRLTSLTTGSAANVTVAATSDATVLTALGLTAGSTDGVEGTPGQSPILVTKPQSDGATGTELRAVMLATLQTTALSIDNLDSESATTITYAIAGDLVATPAGC